MSVLSAMVAGVSPKVQMPVFGSKVPCSVVTTSEPKSRFTGPGISGTWAYRMVRSTPVAGVPVSDSISTEVEPSASRWRRVVISGSKKTSQKRSGVASSG